MEIQKNKKKREITMKQSKIAFLISIAIATASLSACVGLGFKQTSTEFATLTYWMELSGTAKVEIQDFAETPLGKKIEENTGIKVQYIHPENTEQFNLMLASNDLPDIIEKNWRYAYPGGPKKALKGNQIIVLNDLIDKNAPNLKKYLEANEEVKKMTTTNDGEYYMAPFVRGDESLLISTGPIVRKDWLDELGLDLPETMADWHNMLKAFKSKSSGAPLIVDGIHTSLTYGVFSAAYGAPKQFFVDDGNIKYGPILDGYRDCLMELNRWYSEGLLDNNFMGVDSKMVDSSMTSGASGATVGALGGGLGKWIAASSEEGYDLVGTPYPVLNKGEKSMFSARQNSVPGYGAAISGKCSNPEEAMKLLDYFYSDEGHILLNFGIEGESYTVVDGYPTYTEAITKNQNGKSMAAMLAQYTRAASLGPFVQDKRYMEQYSSLPQQKKAIEAWSDTNAKDHLMPPISPDENESAEFSKIYNECLTFIDEYTIKFITGSVSFDEWDMYVNQLKSLNIDRLIEIYQNAYDQYIIK